MTETQLPAVVPTIQQQIAEIKQKYDPHQYNMILHQQTILDALPLGVSIIPQVIHIPPHQIWDNKRADFIPAGMVELAATAIKTIGTAMGVKLKRVTDTIHTVKRTDSKTGYVKETLMLLIEYEATILMPDGSVHTEIAGKEEEYTGAHCRERVDTKAKRNAVKQLLNIDLLIPEAYVKNPFLVLKPVFHRGFSAQTDAVLDRIEGVQNEAVKKLYPAQTIDIQKVEPLNLAEWTNRLEGADNLPDLMAVVKELEPLPKTNDERLMLGDIFKARRAYLETGEATPQQVADAIASTTPSSDPVPTQEQPASPPLGIAEQPAAGTRF